MKKVLKDYKLETTTVWDFPERGNWSPHIPRNVILRYSKVNDIVLDQFVGSGTTMIEAVLLNRKGIGIDINPYALNLTRKNLSFNDNYYIKPALFKRDARNLEFLDNDSVDLICTHPPYSNIIKYSNNINGDLSHMDINEFLLNMKKVAKESFRVLKRNKYCAVLMGDLRKNKHMIPLGFKVMEIFIDEGFILKESIIKKQHNCKSTDYWYKRSVDYNFLLIAHEYLFIFRKA